MLYWRLQQRKTFTFWKDLADFLELDESNRKEILENTNFPLQLPYRLAEKIKKNCLKDPVLLQFLPIKQESISKLGFVSDPVGDALSQKCPKLLHKYEGRVLLITTSACAMHCRYCFRRNFPYDTTPSSFENEIAYIKNDSSIHEVILSGGDPLSLSNAHLRNLLFALCDIPHIQIIRFHSRFPIGIPERIDEEFLNILKSCSKQIIFVLHCNHKQELDSDIFSALKKIQCLGIPILNQSVLLKGINDSIEVLSDLFRSLAYHGIIPYYLHQLDKAIGTSHFETSEDTGKYLIEELTKILPGYCIPKYVKELSQESSKHRIL